MGAEGLPEPRGEPRSTNGIDRAEDLDARQAEALAAWEGAEECVAFPHFTAASGRAGCR